MKHKIITSISIFTILTLIVLILFDYNTVLVTPLSQYGVNHWIPESIFIFLTGYWLMTTRKRLLRIITTITMLLYPLLTYSLLYGQIGVTFGMGTGSFFTAIFLVGVLFGIRKRGNQNAS